MEKEELKEYLGRVVDLEALLYKNRKMLDDVELSLGTAEGRECDFSNPRIVNLTLRQENMHMPQPKDVNNRFFESIPSRSVYNRQYDKEHKREDGLRTAMLILQVVLSVVGGPICFVFTGAGLTSGVFSYILVGLIILFVLIGGWILFAKMNISYTKKCEIKYMEECNHIAQRNQERGEVYYNCLLEDWYDYNAKVRAENEKKLMVVKEMKILRNSLKKNIEELEKELEEEYSQNIIHPKYRHFVAVSMFFEYIDTGLCSRLEEGDGAYDRFKRDVYENTVITQLGQIANGLECIKRNQYCMYLQMCSIENTLNETEAIVRKMNASIETMAVDNALTNQLLREYTYKIQRDMRAMRNHELGGEVFD